MAADVIDFPGDSIADVPVGKVLAGAMDADLESIIVIGVGKNGPYHASSSADIGDMLLRMEMFKRDLIERAARQP